MRFLLCLAVFSLLFVGGCTQLQSIYDSASSVTISQKTLDTTMAGYDSTFLSAAVTYRKLYDTNPCPSGTHATTSNVCAEHDIVVQLQKTDQAVQSAFKTTQAQLDSCTASGNTTCSGLGAAYTTLKTAITAAKQIATTYGVI